MPTTSQLELWRSEFGDAYTLRNPIGASSRAPAFASMFGELPIRSALEVGCNRGHNLGALRLLGIDTLAAVEPNACARGIARRRNPGALILEGAAQELPFADATYDLVFTVGVLIHIAPDGLAVAMKEMARVSRRYLLCIEWFADACTEVCYRGHAQALWKTDFDAAWRAACPTLSRIGRGIVNEAGVWDSATWCLYEAPGA